MESKLPMTQHSAQKTIDHSRLWDTLDPLDLPLDTNAFWQQLPSADWPELLGLMDLAADLPLLGGHRAVAQHAPRLWPELGQTMGRLERLQWLVQHPVLPPTAIASRSHDLADGARQAIDSARKELEACCVTNLKGWLDRELREDMDTALSRLKEERAGFWGQLEREQAPELHRVIERAVDSGVLRQITGFDRQRGEMIVTLSLQDLEAEGIAWHRDLYWPADWVGQDVFAVFYALGSDGPEKGGAFLSYHPEDNSMRYFYRQEHQATVLWNGRRSEKRPFHAVTGYHGEDRSRHLIILQCLRP